MNHTRDVKSHLPTSPVSASLEAASRAPACSLLIIIFGLLALGSTTTTTTTAFSSAATYFYCCCCFVQIYLYFFSEISPMR